MSTRVRVVRILVAALAIASLMTITVLTRVSNPPDCRIPNQRALSSISTGAIFDLRWRPDSHLDLGDLRTPTVDQARLPSRFGGNGRPGMWACGWKDAGLSVVIYRSKQRTLYCFGIGCGGQTQRLRWVTCYTIYDRRLDSQVRPRGCLGFPPSS